MTDTDKRLCKDMLMTIKKELAEVSDRDELINFFHTARVLVFGRMRAIMLSEEPIPHIYHTLVNYIDCLEVMVDDPRDTSEDKKELTRNLEEMLGIKKN